MRPATVGALAHPVVNAEMLDEGDQQAGERARPGQAGVPQAFFARGLLRGDIMLGDVLPRDTLPNSGRAARQSVFARFGAGHAGGI